MTLPDVWQLISMPDNISPTNPPVLLRPDTSQLELQPVMEERDSACPVRPPIMFSPATRALDSLQITWPELLPISPPILLLPEADPDTPH
jgi:hypothetical protein